MPSCVQAPLRPEPEPDEVKPEVVDCGADEVAEPWVVMAVAVEVEVVKVAPDAEVVTKIPLLLVVVPLVAAVVPGADNEVVEVVAVISVVGVVDVDDEVEPAAPDELVVVLLELFEPPSGKQSVPEGAWKLVFISLGLSTSGPGSG